MRVDLYDNHMNEKVSNESSKYLHLIINVVFSILQYCNNFTKRTVAHDVVKPTDIK